MNVPHVELVKEKLGAERIQVLDALFQEANGQPPSVPVRRFRAENYKWMDALDSLKHGESLIEQSSDGKDYRIRTYALPLIDAAKPILGQMESLYSRLRELYPECLDDPVSLSALLKGMEGERADWLDALYYLIGAHDVWSGSSTGFPYDEGTIQISESVLRHDSIAEVLAQFYEWHYVNPRQIATSWESEEESEQLQSSFFAQEFKGGFPAWYEELDDTKKALIREIDVGLTKGLSALPTVGLRTLIETVMVEKVGDDGSFLGKLKRFEKAGYTTLKQRDLLYRVLDAGNAAAHRAHFPNPDDLKTCVDVVKHLLEGVYILQPKLEQLEKNTPQRPKE